MSSVYVSEPPTKGKVILNTNMGPLDIELWPKEAPKATRNFVQLCLEGYYDCTIFHRIIKSFLVQGGDPTSTGNGGESIYGAPFADEFHSRLRFNHRGLVACANAGTPHSNGSQFFVTLDRCDWLDRKNTIFGKVTGDSIFNLLRIGDIETDKDDRPLDPQPKILSVEVLWNPFDDIVPRQLPKKSLPASKAEPERADHKTKGVKKLNLLSFGEEAEEEERQLTNVNDKIKSLHDVINDPRFLKEERQEKGSQEVEKKDVHLAVREALIAKKGDYRKERGENISDSTDSDDDDGASFDARMRQQILRKRLERGEVTTKGKVASEKKAKDALSSPPRERVVEVESRGKKLEKLSLKKTGIGSEARAEFMAKADVDMQLLTNAEQERHMQKQKRRRLQGREDDTIAKLNRFKQSVSAKLTMAENKNYEGSMEEDESGWMTNQLKFIPGSSEQDGMTRKDDPNDYVVEDPLLKKGKEKFNRMQAKEKRREREWAGRSLT